MQLSSKEFRRHKMIRSLVILDEWVRFLESSALAEITSIKFRVKDGGVLLIVKASKGDKHFVAFADGDSLIDAATHLCYMLYMKDLRWKKDRYASNTRST